MSDNFEQIKLMAERSAWLDVQIMAQKRSEELRSEILKLENNQKSE